VKGSDGGTRLAETPSVRLWRAPEQPQSRRDEHRGGDEPVLR
jgi:hypothetical protein